MKLILFFILLSLNATAQKNMFFAQNKPSHAPNTIAFSSSQDGGDNGGSTSSLTYSFTVSGGSDRILIVGVQGDLVGGANDITSVTYNGVAMTQILTTSVAGGRYGYMYYLLNPSSGAHNVVITAGSNHYLLSGASEYTGVQGIDNSTSNTNAGNSVTTSLTTVADNCWTVLFAFGYGGGPDHAAGTGSTVRSVGGLHTWGLFDSNGAITPAGLYSMTTTVASAVEPLVHLMISIKPWP